MSRINHGTVELTVGDEIYELKPTLKAIQKIDQRFGGIRPAVAMCGDLSLQAVCAVVAAGAGIGARQAKDLPDEVHNAGVVNVAPKVIEYLELLIDPTGMEVDEDADTSGE